MASGETIRLCSLLSPVCKYLGPDGEPGLNFEAFKNAKRLLEQQQEGHYEPCFRPSVFLKLADPGRGLVPLSRFATYIEDLLTMKSAHGELQAFDDSSSGFLDDRQLQDFFASIRLFELQGMAASRIPTARRMAAQSVMFNHGRRGRVKIVDFVASPVMKDLCEARGALDDGTSVQPTNWFSKESVEAIHDTFLEMDSCMTGRVVPEDIVAYKGARISPFFARRVFEEHGNVCANGGVDMGLEGFVTFIMAWRDRCKPASLSYLFPVFDLGKKGYLRGVDIMTFFKAVEAMWLTLGQDAYPGMCEDVVNEVFDMVKPAQPGRITKGDLRRSGLAHWVLGIMADVWEFWQHENRETQASEQGEGE
eukprot:evm.model.scf_428.7 EVM.evm.TU.scf_428.7   scf_428:61745-65821(-)